MPSKINEKNKIAYILAIADTIEPIKRYEFSALENIYYEKIENGFVLLMSNVDDNDEYKYLRDLPNWVDIHVNYKNNMFVIQSKI